jgi:hypothetical protein
MAYNLKKRPREEAINVGGFTAMAGADFQILCVPPGRTHGRTHGYKGSLLNVRERKYKREPGGRRWSLPAERERASVVSCFYNLH